MKEFPLENKNHTQSKFSLLFILAQIILRKHIYKFGTII